ncbi:hypothetical protein [Paraburkholderia sp. J12]|uniref:hypothetical protein n=1 Tax=Paraburkholderia sp. J12 TaxID=2805432 RepID=UPI002ABD83D0|nr:hypothetical protein [Paraburkholderia sp. J12]
MKIRLALTAVCLAAVAGSMPGTAQAKDDTSVQQRGHQSMTDDANASAQAETDMSYGGVPDTGSMSGGRMHTGKMCWPRSQCEAPAGQ